ncbi:MAG TPA: ribonuclease Z [Balneolales bacterium]|nr:ribonuclease Z [Balneolales bacterium]
MIVVPLGVSSATPTVNRNLPSVALWREGRVFLFDCGENTQAKMLQAGIKRSKIEYIFISHLDGDHYFGLLGLLSTLNMQRRNAPLTLVGPKRLKKFVEFNLDIAEITPEFELNYVELEEDFEEEIVVDEDEFYVKALPLEHTKFCIGYRFQEKDKPGKVDAKKASQMGIVEDTQFKELKAGNDVELDDGTIVKSSDIVGEPRTGHSFAYVTDTQYSPNAIKLGEKASILYHEATFGNALADRAKETGHSTAEMAARVAEKAKAKLLVIGHFSGRYTNEFVLMKEARKIFNETWIATEMRPIMTDPEHENGIITPRVKSNQKAAKQLRKSKNSYNHNKKGYNKKRTKKRKTFKRRSFAGSNNSKKFSEYYTNKRGGQHNKHHDKKDDKNRQNKPKDNPKYKPITPRTPFDEYNRF